MKYSIIGGLLLSFSGAIQGAAFPPTIAGVVAAAQAKDRDGMLDAYSGLFKQCESARHKRKYADALEKALKTHPEAHRFAHTTRLEIAIRAVQDPDLGQQYMPVVDHAILHGAVSTAALARIAMLYSGKGIEPFAGLTCEPDAEAAHEMALAVLDNAAYLDIDRGCAASWLAHHALCNGSDVEMMGYLKVAAQFGHVVSQEQYDKRMFVYQVQHTADLFKAGNYADAKQQVAGLLKSPYMTDAQRVEIEKMINVCDSYLKIGLLEKQHTMLEGLVRDLPESDVRRANALQKLSKVVQELVCLKGVCAKKYVTHTLQSQAARGSAMHVEKDAEGKMWLVSASGTKSELKTGGDIEAWKAFIASATAPVSSSNDEIL